MWYGGTALIVLILFGVLLYTQYIKERFLSEQLAKTFWDKALHQRDENHDPLKASHDFMRAAQHTTQPGVAKNAQLAGAILVQNSELSAILSFQGIISSARFQSHENGILIQSDDGTTHLWNVKTDMLSPMPASAIKRTPSELSKIAWSPDGKQFLTWYSKADGPGIVELWDRVSNTIVTVRVHRGLSVL